MKTLSESGIGENNTSDAILTFDESKIVRDVIKVEKLFDEDGKEIEDQTTLPPKANGNVWRSINEALSIAKPGSIIQISAGTYGESLVIKIPNLIIESFEEDGKVILLSGKRPWITVAIDAESRLEINRIRMVHMGPNFQNNFTQKIDMNYEKEGNSKCMAEFNFNSAIPGVLRILSGNVTLNRWVLSLNGVAAFLTEKVPCVALHNDTSVNINNCFLFGDSKEEVTTTGVVGINPYDISIKDTVIKDHLGGGVMLSLPPAHEDTNFQIINNKILNCKTAGVYVEGNDSELLIEGNEIIKCRAVGIRIVDGVNADIRENQLLENNDGIQIINNSSNMIANEIEKWHGHGITISNDHNNSKNSPMIKGNTISNCKFNGIQISGENGNMKIGIYNNTVNNNRKWGIKIMNNACADIIGRNFIHTNYNQGICIVEGSSWKIIENTISKNLKANIAYGGRGSGNTIIERNKISESMSEGIFLVKGEDQTLINENIIRENLDGITLCDSNGKIFNNLIESNQRWGIQCSGTTIADISKNQIKSNILIGIMVKDLSDPKIGFNVLKDNHYQFSFDKKISKCSCLPSNRGQFVRIQYS